MKNAKNTLRTVTNLSASTSPDNSGTVIDRPATHEANGDADTETNGVAMLDEAATELVARAPNIPASLRKHNRFLLRSTEESKAAEQKMRLFGEVKQVMSHVVELQNMGEHKQKEAQEEAAKIASRLYQARINGLLDQTQVSTLLGDGFGWKMTKSGTQSKTPNGLGEVLRKRIVRAVNAAEYVRNDSDDRFFEGLPKDAVESVLVPFEAGNTTVWALYDRLAEIKRENADRTEAAFDPKRILAIVSGLKKDGAADKILANPALEAAYATLVNIILVIGEDTAEAE